MSISDDREHALVFGAAAEDYQRLRPSPPAEALDWMLESGSAGLSRVADVGAGTGLLTRELLARGLDVVAVEPDPRMTEVLLRELPAADVRAGFAEALPLETSDVDAVVFGSSFHWVDPVKAIPEVARVTRPGGRFAAVWTTQDDTVDWIAAMRAEMLIAGGASVEDDKAAVLQRYSEVPLDSSDDSFHSPQTRVVTFESQLRDLELIDLACTFSRVIALTAPERAMLRERLAAVIAAADPPRDAQGRLIVPMAARAWRAVRS